jgi:hypothetical protein
MSSTILEHRKSHLKFSKSQADLDASRIVVGFLHKKSLSDPNKWLWRHFRWDCEWLRYSISDMSAPKWRVHLSNIATINMTRGLVNGEVQWVLELRLVDGKLIELSHASRKNLQLWVDSFNLAIV